VPQQWIWFAGIGSAVAAVGLFWNYLRIVWQRVSTLIVGRFDASGSAGGMVARFCQRELKHARLGWGIEQIDMNYPPVQSLRRHVAAFSFAIGKGRLFRHRSGWVWIAWARGGQPGDGQNPGGPIGPSVSCRGFYLRGYFDLREFLRDAEEFHNRWVVNEWG
jgi:hypothetical protein